MNDPSQTLASRLSAVRDEVERAAARSGRLASAVRLVMVTKAAPPAIFGLARALGVADVGENRVQSAVERMSGYEDAFRWHFIGHLQSNKARRVVERFDVLHGIDSESLLRRVDSIATELSRAPRVLLQVNVSGESSKMGLEPEQVLPLVRLAASLGGARLVGLMTMAPRADEAEATRPVFVGLRELRDDVAAATGHELPELSMGMTEDFPIAVEEGATLLRVGRRLVGDLLSDAVP